MNKLKTIVALMLFFSLPKYVLAGSPVLEPESWSFPDVIEHARKISPNNIEGKPFNQFGLAYSSEEVSSLTLSTLPAKELQKYADIVTHAYPDAVAKQLPTKCDNLPVEKLNETAVAGVAYVSINAADSNTRKRAAECLVIIQSNFAKIGR
ncbi:hypothetical protein ACFSJ3_16975 [Corallincola platygyrae]|uniref:Uncharacterized protein n=1 Tax=Corallincola platygyrae TaxID=1193278 RepID=A0ABW4XRF9_9GAMM